MRIVGNNGRPKTREQLTNYYGYENFGTLGYYTSNNPTTKKKLNTESEIDGEMEAFIHAILHLRRIEFWGEGNRWFDVKRYGIEITRRRVPSNSGQDLVELDKLVIRDKRRAIQLPQGVIAAGMTPNPR
jgi:hypothetical protein